MSETNSGFVDFKTIKRSISMLQILEHYSLTHTLKRNGDSLSGPCPLHGGQTKGQFKVSISKNCWHCFGRCKTGGNILDFVSQKEKIGIREAAIFLKERFALQSVPASKSNNQSIDNSPQELPVTDDSVSTVDDPKSNKPLGFSLKYLDPDHPYLTECGLSQDTVTTFGLGFCNKGILTGRIAIPIHNINGELVAYTGRWPGTPPNSKDKYKFPEGFKKTLEVFNIHRAINEPSDRPLITVHSIFDCIRIWQTGLRRIVAIMGNMLSQEQSELLRKAVSPAGRIVLMFNENDTDRQAFQSALMRLSPFCFVKTIMFQPEHVSQKTITELLK